MQQAKNLAKTVTTKATERLLRSGNKPVVRGVCREHGALAACRGVRTRSSRSSRGRNELARRRGHDTNSATAKVSDKSQSGRQSGRLKRFSNRTRSSKLNLGMLIGSKTGKKKNTSIIASRVTTSTRNSSQKRKKIEGNSSLAPKVGAIKHTSNQTLTQYKKSRNQKDNSSAHKSSEFKNIKAETSEAALRLIGRIPTKKLIRDGEKEPHISSIYCNVQRNELCYADLNNYVVRTTRLRDNSGDFQDVYRGTAHNKEPLVLDVCHAIDSDKLFMCTLDKGPKKNLAHWLVELSRNGAEWREANRVKTAGIEWICCGLSDSRVLIGEYLSTHMDMFRVESGPRIEHIHPIQVPQMYYVFSATYGNNTLVAMIYREDQSVRVYQLLADRLEERASVQLKEPTHILWIHDFCLNDRLLVSEYDKDKDSYAVCEFEVSDQLLKRRRELISYSEFIIIRCWCAVASGFAIMDDKSKALLHYSFEK